MIMRSAEYITAFILVALTKQWKNTASFVGIVLEETASRGAYAGHRLADIFSTKQKRFFWTYGTVSKIFLISALPGDARNFEDTNFPESFSVDNTNLHLSTH
eukprot:sb/3478342/